MKKKLSVMFLMFVLMLFVSCKKDSDDPTNNNNNNPIQTTDLKINVREVNGDVARYVDVELYTSLNDLATRSNQVGTTKNSGESGYVTFTNLQPIKYYYFCKSGCKINKLTTNNTGFSITTNTLNSANATMEETGTLKLVSTSSNPYKIYYDGQVLINSMPGGSSNYTYYVPAGSHSIRYYQLSGYVLYPTDETVNLNISCNYITTLTFP